MSNILKSTITCKYCGVNIEYEDYDIHRDWGCGRPYLKCPLCGSLIYFR